jgi:serine/threonine protein phosphatase PrpC
MLAAHGVTHNGTVRPHNEDTILTDLELGLFVIADGMGGVNAGEVASQLAVEAIHGFIEQSSQQSTHPWPFGLDQRLSRSANRVRTAVLLANRTVLRSGEQQEQYTGMGTTVAVVLVEGHSATICGIGDSRVYLVGHGRVEQLTTDHTWVETIRTQDPTIEPEVLARHPMRHVLTAVVGGHNHLDVTVTEHTVEPGCRLVICSDGVNRGVSDDLLREIATEGSVEDAAAGIVAAALQRDGRDNISAVVVEPGET